MKAMKNVRYINNGLMIVLFIVTTAALVYTGIKTILFRFPELESDGLYYFQAASMSGKKNKTKQNK